ncbi:hypothetical protein V2A60_009947 [Cordyceps javanica]|uniref:2EXR domain-containing protein n=1 Tax=Cordyceps javanica TaxID=43265 RepID=A0A545UZS3_9HYPO|nr:hypothetical protein IF1G_05962 [Cordyceps javanica]TQW05816.1 hypothetical protein IF2G_06938 [Cordyceps javanica]
MRPNGVAPSPTFTLFRQLPCELRLKIWHDSLPATEGSAVYFFRDWKWKPEDPTRGRGGAASPILETDDDLGEDVVHPHVPVHLPQISVSYEARQVALRWAARHGLDLRIHERAWDEEHDAGGRIVVRPWQPRRGDAVYVCRDRWDDFCRRPCTFPFDGQAAVYYGTADCGYAAASSSSCIFGRPAPRSVEIRTLAVPIAVAVAAVDQGKQEDDEGDDEEEGRDEEEEEEAVAPFARALAGLLHCLPNLTRLQLVYGPVPQPYEREDEALVPRRWALESAHEASDSGVRGGGGVRPFYYTDAPRGGGRYAAREGETPLRGEALQRHVEDVERALLREVKRCEVESEARDAVEGNDRLPFTLEAVVFARRAPN